MYDFSAEGGTGLGPSVASSLLFLLGKLLLASMSVILRALMLAATRQLPKSRGLTQYKCDPHLTVLCRLGSSPKKPCPPGVTQGSRHLPPSVSRLERAAFRVAAAEEGQIKEARQLLSQTGRDAHYCHFNLDLNSFHGFNLTAQGLEKVTKMGMFVEHE